MASGLSGVARSVLGRRVTYASLLERPPSHPNPYKRKQWRGQRQRAKLPVVKSPKVEDLKFEPNQAFERLRKLARSLLTVGKKEIDEMEPKKPRGKRPLAGARS